jgi:hypothetical protein
VATHHDNFYVVVATVIPILYVVVAFQPSTLDRAYQERVVNWRRYPEWFRRWNNRALNSSWNSAFTWVLRGVFIVLPMSAVLVSASSLKDNSDQGWKRTWAWYGLIYAVIYTLLAIVAAFVTNAALEETPNTPSEPGSE